jgi:hypothetical protein
MRHQSKESRGRAEKQREWGGGTGGRGGGGKIYRSVGPTAWSWDGGEKMKEDECGRSEYEERISMTRMSYSVLKEKMEEDGLRNMSHCETKN